MNFANKPLFKGVLDPGLRHWRRLRPQAPMSLMRLIGTLLGTRRSLNRAEFGIQIASIAMRQSSLNSDWAGSGSSGAVAAAAGMKEVKGRGASSPLFACLRTANSPMLDDIGPARAAAQTPRGPVSGTLLTSAGNADRASSTFQLYLAILVGSTIVTTFRTGGCNTPP